MLNFLLQAAQQLPSNPAVEPTGIDKIANFIENTGMLKYYLLLLFILWLLARRGHEKKDFSAEAQAVLDEKFKKGELDRKTYEKYRQELSMRVKKD